ncbi:hypothetical protein LX32DRAFT_635615, partial [Colletotrichum zoysiae]
MRSGLTVHLTSLSRVRMPLWARRGTLLGSSLFYPGSSLPPLHHHCRRPSPAHGCRPLQLSLRGTTGSLCCLMQNATRA